MSSYSNTLAWSSGPDKHQVQDQSWPPAEPDPQLALFSTTRYCLSCDSLVPDHNDCIASDHIVQVAMATRDSFPHSTRLVQSNTCLDEISGDDSTRSGRSNVFSTGSSLESSGTHNSVFEPHLMLLTSTGLIGGRDTGSFPVSTLVKGSVDSCKANVSNNAASQDYPHAHGLGAFSDTQIEKLQSCLQGFENEHQPPTDREIELVARLVGVEIEAARTWFRIHLQKCHPSQRLPSSSTQQLVAATCYTHIASSVSADVIEYARIRNTRDCENSRSKKKVNGNYSCPFGCGYSTDDLDDWRRHLETTYPQKFWRCALCSDAGRKPFICHRIDKFRPHLKKDHLIEDSERCADVRNRSQVLYTAKFPPTCRMRNNNGTCNYRPTGWENFIQHCLCHFQDYAFYEPFQLRPPQRKEDPEDDDDDWSQNKPCDSGSWGFKTSKLSGNKPQSSQPGRCGNNQDQNRQRDYLQLTATSQSTWETPPKHGITIQAESAAACLSSATKTSPSQLIDVHLNRLVIPPGKAKFLALDYSWASQNCSQSALLTTEPCSQALAIGKSCKDLQPAFQRAIALTREMGYQYLWIDVVCGEDGNISERRLSVYQQATLIIVIVGLSSSADHIWHLTCHFKNLETVLSWAKKSILSFLHVQNLGHGAFGIVDEVRLSQTPQSFARKMCFGRKDDEILFRMDSFQEIEILQRFNHPNIPQFVAAYVQKRHLNILMLPVAECNLKEYMAEPWHWSGKKKHIKQWFFSLASALEHMHNLSCRHKDIKPANVLISGENVLLSDFGTSKDFSASCSSSEGPGLMTPKYCAPEVARQKRRGRPADIFSLGCVFVEMITVDVGLPLKRLSLYLESHRVAGGKKVVYCQNITSLRSWLHLLDNRLTQSYQRTLVNICKAMLDLDPAQRPSASEVLDATSFRSEKLTCDDASLGPKSVWPRSLNTNRDKLMRRFSKKLTNHAASKQPGEMFQCRSEDLALSRSYTLLHYLLCGFVCFEGDKPGGTAFGLLALANSTVPTLASRPRRSGSLPVPELAFDLWLVSLGPLQLYDGGSTAHGRPSCRSRFHITTTLTAHHLRVRVRRTKKLSGSQSTRHAASTSNASDLMSILLINNYLAPHHRLIWREDSNRGIEKQQVISPQEYASQPRMATTLPTEHITELRSVDTLPESGCLGDVQTHEQTHTPTTHLNDPPRPTPNSNHFNKVAPLRYGSDNTSAWVLFIAVLAVLVPYIALHTQPFLSCSAVGIFIWPDDSFEIPSLRTARSVDSSIIAIGMSMAVCATPTTITLTVSETCTSSMKFPASPYEDVIGGIWTAPTQAPVSQTSPLLLQVDCNPAPDESASEPPADTDQSIPKSAVPDQSQNSHQQSTLNPAHITTMPHFSHESWHTFEIKIRGPDAPRTLSRAFIEQAFLSSTATTTVSPCVWSHSTEDAPDDSVYLGLLYSDEGDGATDQNLTSASWETEYGFLGFY